MGREGGWSKGEMEGEMKDKGEREEERRIE